MSRRRTGQRVNRAQLAEVFGVSLPTIDAWTRAGCPCIERGARGREWVFDTAEVVAWREQRAADEAAGEEVQDEAALKRRKLSAETKVAELAALQAMGDVAPVADMERALTKVAAEIQGQLRGAFVTRVVSQLLGENDERTFKKTLLSEVDSTLEILAGLDVSDVDDDGGDDGED